MAINILLLADFSAQALNAGKYALNVHAASTNFYVLHAGKSNSEGLQSYLENLTREPGAAGHKFHLIYSSDNLIDATRKAVAEKNIDLIVT